MDFIEGKDSALQFYTCSPLEFQKALSARKDVAYNRKQAADSLYSLNRTLGASQNVLDNIEALRKPDTFCVISGQQVGFFGGPVFTAYKIITTIQLSLYLTELLGVRCVPVFWGASEDHDFYEINHVNIIKHDGEVGKVSFPWNNIGNSVYDLPLDESIRTKANSYITLLNHDMPYCSDVVDIFRPRRETGFVQWVYTLISRIFSRYGLVIADPRVLRPHMGDLFGKMRDRREQIEVLLRESGEKIQCAGYSPVLDSSRAGRLYTYTEGGKRIRLDRLADTRSSVEERSREYSPDVALRPLFADTALPVVVSVLGPGEITYTAQLKELYDLFEVPQPLIFPRKSFTLIDGKDAARLNSYGIDISHILRNGLSADDIFKNHFDSEGKSKFQQAKTKLSSSFLPLKDYVTAMDPNLEKTWQRSLEHATYQLNKLEEKTLKTYLSRTGYSKKELQALKNMILPKGQLQERILPLPHFISAFGTGFLHEDLMNVPATDFTHCIVKLS